MGSGHEQIKKKECKKDTRKDVQEVNIASRDDLVSKSNGVACNTGTHQFMRLEITQII